MWRIVLEVKNSFITVFSVFHNLVKPTWLGLVEKKFCFAWGIFFSLFPNTEFLRFFSAQIALVKTLKLSYFLEKSISQHFYKLSSFR
jgi:ABC-type polysaccharide transport system permease subunit